MASMSVADYIMQFLVNNGVHHLFLISGGGMMHLLDAAYRNDGLELVFNLNEQASAICAESYAQFTGNIGACMVTTGPGATNAVTGCAGAWLDSTPAFFISGQCRTEQLGQIRGLRFYGAQEVAIVPCVKPITKYAVTVLNKDSIRYHLEKALYFATHGRKGPVWIDVPLDVQGALINPETLVGFDSSDNDFAFGEGIDASVIDRVYELLDMSKRPVVLIGHGVIAAKRQQEIRMLVESLRLPVLATWRAKGVFGDEEPLFMGCPGIPAARYSNFVLQNADFLIIIGTRLNAALTAYNERGFAPKAKKVIVDIETAEIDKLEMSFELKITSDAADFIDRMLAAGRGFVRHDWRDWLRYCALMKQKYPLSGERQPADQEGKVDAYQFADRLSNYSQASDVFVGSSSGRSCGISHMAYRLKRGQSFVTSMGLGSMGWVLPSAIACCIASGKRRTLLIEGDGSLQHNIQELQLISTYDLPVKLFVLENGGYASIYGMQSNNFEGRYAGCTPQSGLMLPSLKAIANTYNLAYFSIDCDEQIDDVLKEIMADESPCLCEITCSIRFDEIPKSVTVAHSDGTFTSSGIDNLYPFLTEEELMEAMPEWDKV